MKEFLTDDLLASVGVRMVSLSCSSFPATGLPVLACTGRFSVGPGSLRIEHSCVRCRSWCRETNKTSVSVNPMFRADSKYLAASFDRGSAFHEDLEELQAYWERGISVLCELIRRLESPQTHKMKRDPNFLSTGLVNVVLQWLRC